MSDPRKIDRESIAAFKAGIKKWRDDQDDEPTFTLDQIEDMVHSWVEEALVCLSEQDVRVIRRLQQQVRNPKHGIAASVKESE